MSRLLEGKVAFVTGGDKGMGAAISEALIREGVSALIIGYRSDRKAVEATITAASEARVSQDQTIERLKGDISTNEDREAFFERLDATLIRLTGVARMDIVVNAAAIQKNTPKDKTHTLRPASVDEFAEAMKDMMLRESSRMQMGGRIISLTNNLVSDSGDLPAEIARLETVAAMRRLASEFSKRLDSYRITVNTISPGPLGALPGAWTKASGSAFKPAEAVEAQSRLGDAAGVAQAVIDLACPHSRNTMSRHIWSKARLMTITW